MRDRALFHYIIVDLESTAKMIERVVKIFLVCSFIHGDKVVAGGESFFFLLLIQLCLKGDRSTYWIGNDRTHNVTVRI